MDKTDFKNYRALAREVRQLKAQLSVLESSLYSPKGQQFSKTPRGGGGPKKTMDDAVAGHIKLDTLYHERLAVQEAELFRLEQAVGCLADSAERLVMRFRYFDGHSWPVVIREMQKLGYSERTVYRLHGYALQKLKEL